MSDVDWEEIDRHATAIETARNAYTATLPPDAAATIGKAFDTGHNLIPAAMYAAFGKIAAAVTEPELQALLQGAVRRKGKHWWDDLGGVAYDTLKGTIRGATTVLQSPLEYGANLAVGGYEAVTNPDSQFRGRGFAGLIDMLNTAGEGTALAHLFDSDQGSGFFQGGAAAADKIAEQRSIRGVHYVTDNEGRVQRVGDPTLAGFQTSGEFGYKTSTPTVGRVAATTIGYDDADWRYQFLSGAIDGALAIWADPVNKVGGVTREIRTARNTILPAAENLTDVRSTAGLINGLSKTVNPKTADDFLDSRLGRSIVELHTQNTSGAEAFRLLGRRADPLIARELAATSTVDETRAVFVRYLGKDAALTDIRDMPGVITRAASRRGWFAGTAVERAYARQHARMYSTHLYVGDDPLKMTRSARITAVKQVDDMLATAKVATDVRDGIVGELIDAMAVGSRQGKYEAITAAHRALYHQFVAYGMDPAMAKVITRFDRGADDFVRLYGIDAVGNADDGGLLSMLATDGATRWADITAISPLLLSEGWQGNVDLLTGRQVKALTSRLGRLWHVSMVDPDEGGVLARALKSVNASPGYKAVDAAQLRKLLASDDPGAAATVRDALDAVGQLRLPFALVDKTMDLWRKAVVYRPATVLRVLGEEQARLAEVGHVSAFRHPLQYIAFASGHSKTGMSDILGNKWVDDLASLTDEQAAMQLSDYAAALNNPSDKYAQTFGVRTARKMRRTGAIETPLKSDHPRQWIAGAMHELRTLHRDPVVSAAAADMITGGLDPISLATRIQTDPKFTAAYRNLIDIGRSGVRGSDGAFHIIDFEQLDALALYVDTTIRSRIEQIAGHNQDLLTTIAKGQIKTTQVVDNSSLRVVAGVKSVDGSWVGSTVRHPQHGAGVVTGDVAGKRSTVEFYAPAFNTIGNPTDELHDIVKAWRLDPASPGKVKHFTNYLDRTSNASASGMRLRDAADAATDWFFDRLWGAGTNKLSRSPAFRQFYYAKVADLAPYLDPSEANVVLKTMEANGAGTRLAPAVLDRVVSQAGTASGRFTAVEIDDYAKAYALDQVKALLYDASEKSQFADSLRIVFPFGEAWKEILTRQARLLSRDPTALNTIRKTVEGARGAGFFHTDANGNEVFNYFPSREMIRWFTGVDATMLGSVQGLNIGFDVMPGVGPVVQLAASELLPNKPDFDFIRAVVLPYGERDPLNTILPGWVAKLFDAYQADGTSGTSTYATQLGDALRALIASGEYGTTADEAERLLGDARGKARILTVLRALGQFVLPSSPRYDYTIATGAGDVWASALAREFGEMQQADPTTATEKFLAVYGDDVAAFVVSKTRATVAGLDDSNEFIAWQRDNPDLVANDAYGDVINYFAPIGGGRDPTAFQRQLDAGQRVRRSPEELVSLVNMTIARRRLAEYEKPMADELAAYAASIPVAGKGRTAAQQQRLNVMRNELADRVTAAKQQLEKDYAGYTAAPEFDPNLFNRQLGQLRIAAVDPRLASGDTATAVRMYLEGRDAAVALTKERAAGKAARPGLGARENADIAAWLRTTGEWYATQDVGFARIWDRILAAEVDTQEAA